MNLCCLINSFLLSPPVNAPVSPARDGDFFPVLPAEAAAEPGPPPRTARAMVSGLHPCLGHAGGGGATLRRERGRRSPRPRQTPVSFLSVPTGTAINAKGGGGFNDVDTCSPRNGLGSIWHESLPRLLSHKLLFHKGKAALFINCCR